MLTSQIGRCVVVPRIVKWARDSFVVDDWQLGRILRIWPGLLDLCDVDPHYNQAGGFPNVECVKRGCISFGVGEVVAKEIVVIKKANNL